MEPNKNESQNQEKNAPRNHPDFKGDPAANTSRYSFPDKRERKDGPGGEGQ